MSAPKRHHQLPQVYLGGFTTDGLLWLYDRKLGEFRRQTPSNTTVEGHYYTFVDADGNKSVEVEQLLSRIEGIAAPTLAKVNEREPLTVDDWDALAAFVGFLRTRTREFERTHDHAMSELARRMAKAMFASPERVAQLINRYPVPAGSETTLTPQSLYEFVQSDRYDVKVPKAQRLAAMLSTGLAMAEALSECTWAIGYAPARTSFITSDAPVCLVGPPGPPRSQLRGVGLHTPGAQKFVPLSQQACLMIGNRGAGRGTVELSQGQVGDINAIVAQQSDRFVIARDRRLVERLVERHHLSEWHPEPRIRVV